MKEIMVGGVVSAREIVPALESKTTNTPKASTVPGSPTTHDVLP